MDRASDSGSGGWGFESLRARHIKTSLLIKKWRGENPCLQGFSPFLCPFSGSGSVFETISVYSKGTPRRENPYPVRALEADRRTRPGGEVHRPLRMVNNNYQLYPQTPGVHGAQGFRENRLRELQDQKHPQDRAGGAVYF